nr:bifunctional phosphopantothenoylcysteine decarboxylase/phosphopantothenate--cysteine ligase CoaBC [Planococcus sp. ISL-109]
MVNRKILLCVSGGIAVYKAVALVSKLSQAGADVKVIMTESAKQFVQPLTFQVMSRNDVYFDTFDEKDSSVIAHIDLADWADLVIVAPATANIIAKMANGLGDDMVSTVLLAASAPIWVAPAMNVHMYDHPAVKRNIDRLHHDGVRFIEPSEGFLACGYVGKGRLEEPEKITELVVGHFSKNKPLAGKKVLVTAGPTRERIDPVRFLTNFSSGKMGYAMAQAAADLGAETLLISGPVSLPVPSGVTRISVESAKDMLDAVLRDYDSADMVIKTAAVADYRPAAIAAQKVKKKDGNSVIELERTVDILQQLGQQKDKQVLVGFAAETDHVAQYAKDKLKRKNANYIIANDVSADQAGFDHDTNEVTVYGLGGFEKTFPVLPKTELAHELLALITEKEFVK